MTDARSQLLQRVVLDVGNNGLADRSLRTIAASVGSSHRMLHHHFGSRQGLIGAIVEAVETSQRELLDELAINISDPGELILALWSRVSSAEMRPFARLFFECVALDEGSNLTQPWLDSSAHTADAIGLDVDPDILRLGVAVTRGLLIDVLATGDAEPATRSLERFVKLSAAEW